MTEEFLCSLCEEQFEKAWSDEEALKVREYYFEHDKEEYTSVCEPCFLKIMKFNESDFNEKLYK
jgi:thiamine biosynthesis protein ThiC